MKCELCFDNICLDLPSLTKIQGNGWYIHRNMGYVILESMIWFDLINKTFQISLKTTFIMEEVHFPGLPIYKQQVLFISFPFSHLDAPDLENYIRRKSKYFGENSDSDSDCSIFWEIFHLSHSLEILYVFQSLVWL